MVRKVTPNDTHQAFHDALRACVGREGANLQVEEITALTANFLGTLIALNDRRKYDQSRIMEMVAFNIEQGNKNQIEFTLGNPLSRA